MFATASGKRFNAGMYADYLCEDVIPFINAQYKTVSSKEGRSIGGYPPRT